MIDIVLPKLKPSNDKRELLHTICRQVAEEKNVSVWEIKGKKQTPKLVSCRAMLAMRARKHEHIKNKDIAKFLNKDISTISHYTNKYNYRGLS